MDKRAATRLLQRLALAHELAGDPARGKRFGRAAWPLRSIEGELEELCRSGALLRERGMSRPVLEALTEALGGGKPRELEELEERIPPGLFAVAEVKGLGPSRVKKLWEELEISSLAELEYACLENRLLTLPGFGSKLQAQVLDSARHLRATEGLARRDQASSVVEALRARAPGAELHVVGELRRGCELVSAVELVLVGTDQQAVALAEGIASPVPLRLHACAPETLGTALVRLTGSAAHLEALGPLPNCADEDEVYRQLGWCTPEPERREAEVALVKRGQARKELVSRASLRGSLHNHTTASDGASTLEEMRAAAGAWGLAWLGIAEHSVGAFYAQGLEAQRLADQKQAIARLNRSPGPTLLDGIESEILPDGSLDYGDEGVLEALQVVVASLHSRHGQDASAMTPRMIRAASNPRTDVLGHPTGRLLLGRAPAPFDVEAVLDAAAANGCAVELNANPHRLDLSVEHLALARERGLVVSLSADAHHARELDNLEHGLAIARRAGLGPEEVLSCWSLDRLQGWLQARRERQTTSS